MNDGSEMKYTMLHLRRQNGKDKFWNLSIGRSMAWFVLALVLIVLTVYGVTQLPPPVWDFLRGGRTSVTHSELRRQRVRAELSPLLVQQRNILDRLGLGDRLDIRPHIGELLIGHDVRSIGRHAAPRRVARGCGS